jgi:hypothetical protein
VSDVTSSEHGPGTSAVLAVVVAVGGAVLTAAVLEGDLAAFYIFVALLTWVVVKLTGVGNPWVAVIVVSIGFFAAGMF